jgi:hypothetical protein
MSSISPALPDAMSAARLARPIAQEKTCGSTESAGNYCRPGENGPVECGKSENISRHTALFNLARPLLISPSKPGTF